MNDVKGSKALCPLLTLVGPTAVGKTEIALRVAKRLTKTEIISADSVQVYRYMDIGTAKPSLRERSQVTHHLIDVVDPDEHFTVYDYQKEAVKIAKESWSRGNLPILTGGTGLYVRAVIRGYSFSKQGDNNELREILQDQAEKEGTSALFEKLAEVDPRAAAKIHPHDLRRIIRALEVYLATGKPISSQEVATERRKPVFDPLVIGLFMERDLLYSRIEERVEKMFAQGFLSEVEQLLARGYAPTLKSMQSLGYRHLIRHLKGELTLAEAKAEIKRDTRRYAKRQLTWFRRDPEIKWLKVPPNNIFPLVVKICTLTEGKYGFWRE